MNKQENKKPTEKKGTAMSGILLASFFMFLLGVLAIRGGLKGLRAGGERQSAEQNLQDRMESLPVLNTDEEISNALSGEPKDYLIRNYVFKNPPTIKDTAFNLLTGDYICVYVIEENLAYVRKSLRNKGERRYFTRWQETPYCQISAPLRFNNGVEISKPENLEFMFSFADRLSKIKKSELNPDLKDHFFKQRFYADYEKKYSLSSIINEVEVTKKVAKTLNENRGEDIIVTDEKRYNFTYMATDEPATFAVRLGGGKADLNVFPDKNLILVGGGRISTGSYGSTEGAVFKIASYIIMFFGILVAAAALVFVIAAILSQKKAG